MVDVFDVQRPGWRAVQRLSEARGVMAGAVCGQFAVFAGGQTLAGVKSAAVDVWDSTTQGWRAAPPLPVARAFLAAAAVGPLVLFAGGELVEHEGNSTTADDTARVDVLNVGLARWVGVHNLTVARKKLAATTVVTPEGHVLALFGGGYLSGNGSQAAVDVFNGTSGTWRAALLREARMRLQACTVGRRAMFVAGLGAAGASRTVDVYDATSGAWTVEHLQRARYEFSCVALASAAVVAGGKQPNNTVWDLAEVFRLTPGSTVQGTWTQQLQPDARSYCAGAGASPTTALLAGGDFQNGTRTATIMALSVQ